jgi:hypothetical protein
MAGPHVLSFYYSNGDDRACHGAVTVNDSPLRPVRFAPTGDAASWRAVEMVALLAAGRNTVRVAVDGALQVDSLTVVMSPVAVAAANDGQLVNLSTRARVGVEGVTGGFVLVGDGRRDVLVRAAGPALSGLGVVGTLAQPRLTLFDGAGRSLATNTGWSTPGTTAAAIAAAASSTGAFAFGNGSTDSALLATLESGSFTAQITGADGGRGETLIEIYVVGAGGPALVNLSTLGVVGGDGTDPLAGFVIAGGAKTLLLRGIGPALARFGVGGATPDPTLTVFSSAGERIFANDNWSSGLAPDEVAAAAVRCGAFSLSAGSKDAALVATLAPGAYTVRLGSVTAPGGAGLIEVYVVP